ncbi:sigma-70 family RNA polymerase sigma factor [Rubellicoccus peritrichatus]|uniref:Sigma-70 family RNA polymerase sigma factor n=1 Tax=Rubellicoccus peritrichatus TaxID=3080537 RepID=A0AAQ3LEE7_9BACT|nr:sigma-70 family RNA polymerase sigma factor [Puniceicoccus sp. CR14]WOO43029.1 sigma-70 family RNA polymerase sigma factor [Puniceicoccus sp. CR14]
MPPKKVATTKSLTSGAHSSMSDESLIQAMNDGEYQAFDALYLRYRKWVVGVAYRLTRDQESAEDVLQETFLYFFNKFPGFELICRLKSFLYPVVRSFSLNIQRRQAKTEAGLDPDALTEVCEPKDSPDFAMEDLDYALADLPQKQREILLLRFVDDFSLEEISQSLDLPLSTVKTRLYSTLKALRRNKRLHQLFPGKSREYT